MFRGSNARYRLISRTQIRKQNVYYHILISIRDIITVDFEGVAHMSIIFQELLRRFFSYECCTQLIKIVVCNSKVIRGDFVQVSETTKEVAQFSFRAPSDVPYKDMANHCEALQIGKQQIMSNFINSPLLIEDSSSSSSQDSAPAHDMLPHSCLRPGDSTVSCFHKRVPSFINNLSLC